MCPINTSNIGQILDYLTCLLGKGVLPLLMTLAVVAFIYGVITFYLAPANEEKRKKGKEFMVWGIIALFVMVSVWGLVRILIVSFGVENTTAPNGPQVDFNGSNDGWKPDPALD